MNNLCCRLAYLNTPDRIARIFKKYGKGVKVFDNTGEDEPPHGWIMNKPKEGYPCDHLAPDGCKFELNNIKKPLRCQDFPSSEGGLHLIDTCGFSFVAGVRQGSCNRCIKE